MRRSGQGGFTLLEAIISFAMLGILMVGFLAAFVNGYDWIHRAGFNLGDDYTAVSQLEEALSGGAGGTDTLQIQFDGSKTVTGTWIEDESFRVFRPNPNP